MIPSTPNFGLHLKPCRLTYFEFMRGCKQMDLMNARRIWCALGRTGFIMLQDIDAKLGEQLGSLAGLLWCTFGSVEQAWRTCFNKTSKLRIGHDEFKQACHEVKFKGDSWLCFTELCSEKASTGMSRKEFGFLHSWIQPGKPDRGFIDNPPSRWDLPSQPWAPPPSAVKKGSRRKRFKDLPSEILWRPGHGRNNGKLLMQRLLQSGKIK